jgi:menaquinone-dependent protoporphyrinogen oxidase
VSPRIAADAPQSSEQLQHVEMSRRSSAMSKVLVAYASKYGSTGEVAEAIAARLRERGSDALAAPVESVETLDGISAAVLGVALYFFRWRGEAHRFLKHHRRALQDVPVAVYGMGPIEDTPEQYTEARKHLDKGLAKHAWLTPVSVAVFGGRLDPKQLRFPDNNPAMRQMGEVDLRDWEAIDRWTDELLDVFGTST